MKYTVYHGSDEEFDKFDFSKGGTQQGKIKGAMHFTSSKENAEYYGWYIYQVEISIPDSKVFYVKKDNAIQQLGKRVGIQELIITIKKENPDRELIIIGEVRDPHIESDIFILFNSKYIINVSKIRT